MFGAFRKRIDADEPPRLPSSASASEGRPEDGAKSNPSLGILSPAERDRQFNVAAAEARRNHREASENEEAEFQKNLRERINREGE